MPSSLNGTGVTFNDGSTQNTAFLGEQSQLFTASGTFTTPANVSRVKITCIGGGGGASVTYGGTGGNGGVAIGYYTVTPSTGYTVTVGTGGASVASGTTGGSGTTSSFASLISATGGAGKVASGSPVSGTGSGGTILNYRRGTQYYVGITGVVATFNNFFGLTTRVPYTSANTLAAVAWSPTLVGAYTGDVTDTMAVLPGAAGGTNGFGCSSFAAGGVGGVVLVEW
jgi:hypothetical protein